MFESIKKHFATANAIGEVGHSFEYLNQQFAGIKRMPKDEAVNAILFLNYYFNLEIAAKCDKYELGFKTKVAVNGSWIPIGSLFGQMTTYFSEFMIQYDLQNEFNEILEKGPLYYVFEEYYEVVKKEAGIK